MGGNAGSHNADAEQGQSQHPEGTGFKRDLLGDALPGVFLGLGCQMSFLLVGELLLLAFVAGLALVSGLTNLLGALFDEEQADEDSGHTGQNAHVNKGGTPAGTGDKTGDHLSPDGAADAAAGIGNGHIGRAVLVEPHGHKQRDGHLGDGGKAKVIDVEHSVRKQANLYITNAQKVLIYYRIRHEPR